MMNSNLPLVTILTPVYNGEKYLAECIESVLAQNYQNWEYIIVNNCSQDKTLEIAQSYANKNKQIKVVTNHHFVTVIENHNIAFQLISPQSKYCKVVSSDDWITPECLSSMVKIAEAHPTVGIVGSCQQSGKEVRWKGLPTNLEFISGREVCRRTFIDNLDVFGNPTSNLYRADLIRNNELFFPHLLPYADTSACFEYLQKEDFGFSHEILSMGRIHEHQVSARVRKLGMGNLATLEHFLKYGPVYLTEQEFKILKEKSFDRYYRWLGGCLLKLNNREFWKYHISGLKELGYTISWRKVISGAIDEMVEEIQNPGVAFQKMIIALKGKYCELIVRKS